MAEAIEGGPRRPRASSDLLDRLNEATKFADEWPINPDRATSYSAGAIEVLELKRVLAEDIRPA